MSRQYCRRKASLDVFPRRRVLYVAQPHPELSPRLKDMELEMIGSARVRHLLNTCRFFLCELNSGSPVYICPVPPSLLVVHAFSICCTAYCFSTSVTTARSTLGRAIVPPLLNGTSSKRTVH